MNLQELEEQSGHPARLIRFLIGQDVVPRPSGGKRFASYGDEHLRALSIYGAAKSEGIDSLDVIRARIEAGDPPQVHVVAPGIEVRIEKGSVPDIGAFIEAVKAMVEKTKGE